MLSGCKSAGDYPGYDCIAKESGVVSINGANVFADIFTMERKESFKKEPVIKRMVFDVSRFINNPGGDFNIPSIPVNSRDLSEFDEMYALSGMPKLLEIILNMKVGNDTLMESMCQFPPTLRYEKVRATLSVTF
jgi:hypothetical protein